MGVGEGVFDGGAVGSGVFVGCGVFVGGDVGGILLAGGSCITRVSPQAETILPRMSKHATNFHTGFIANYLLSYLNTMGNGRVLFTAIEEEDYAADDPQSADAPNVTFPSSFL
jgi:hypothetical protein